VNTPSHRCFLVAFAAIILLGLISCAETDALQTITVSIEGMEFTIEVARTPEEQQRGLMYRRSLDERSGMLFAYDSDRRLEFWMKNTFVPLSIAFLSSTGEIIEIHDMEPESLRGIPSTRSVRYALELNRGAFEAIGAGPGSVVRFPEGFE
jgi:uncharacterized protein